MRNIIILLLMSAVLSYDRSQLISLQQAYGPLQDFKNYFYHFQCHSIVDIHNGKDTTKQYATYKLSFYPDSRLEDKNDKYFVGWVESYVGADGTKVQGYGNTMWKHQPIFIVGRSLSTGKVSTIKISKELTPDFRNFIASAVQQLIPTVHPNDLLNIGQLPGNDTLIQIDRPETAVSTNGRLHQRILLDESKILIHNNITYYHSLENIKDVEIGHETIDFEGGNSPYNSTIHHDILKTGESAPNTAFVDRIVSLLSQDTTVSKIGYHEFLDQIDREFKKEVDDDVERMIPPVFDESREMLPIPYTSRLLDEVYPIYNHSQTLISQNIFGRTLEMVLTAVCSTKIVNGNTTSNQNIIICEGFLKVSYATVDKSLKLFSFSKPYQNWEKNQTFSNKWGYGIVIGLPPPVSFIQISLKFAIGYSIKVGVFVGLQGNVLSAKANFNAALKSEAEAGVRVVVAEGGVYLQGTIVSIDTEPKVVLTLLPGKFTGLVEWIVYLNAFDFKWGLYYKWCTLLKCGSRHNITTWSVNQKKTKKWTIWSKEISQNL